MNHEPEMIDPALRKILDEDAERIGAHYRQHVAHRQWQFLKAELRRKTAFTSTEQAPSILAWFRAQIDDTRRVLAWLGSATAVAALAMMLGITALRTPYFTVAMVESEGSLKGGGNDTLAELAKTPVQVKLSTAKGLVRLLFEGGVVLEGWAQQVENDPAAARFENPSSFAVGVAGRLPSGEPVTGDGYITYSCAPGSPSDRLTADAVLEVVLKVNLRTAGENDRVISRSFAPKPK